jgi:hypothetical protein
MAKPTVTTESTSRHSADVSEVFVLRETSLTRLIFRASLVDNPHDVEASVRGHLLYQKKGINDRWEDWVETDLTRLKKFEGIKLELKSGEIHTFYNWIGELYELYKSHGIKRGASTFLRVNNSLAAIAELTDDELSMINNSGASLGMETFKRLLRWAVNLRNISGVIDVLEGIDSESLQGISSIVGIENLNQSIKLWDQNNTNSSEEYWQEEISKKPFLLERLFSYPVILIKSKAYVGGKSIDNSGGNVVDYLLKNQLTGNVALVEIKTPTTKLLGTQYRSGIYNISPNLIGSVMQVLDYRKSFTQDVVNLASKSKMHIDSCEPPCIVIIGNTEELDNEDKLKTFELFRRQFIGVEICAFDEMFARVKRLKNVLEGNI